MKPVDRPADRKHFQAMRLLTCLVGLLLANSALSTPLSDKPTLIRSVPVHAATFRDDVSSTGWINFDFADGRSILVPAKVNGQSVLVKLIDGADTSYIDKDFAASIGFQPPTGTKTFGSVSTQVQLGALTLRRVKTTTADLGAKRTDSLFAPFILSDDLFNQVVVDIDFAHRRVAFQDPRSAIQLPNGAVEIPLIRHLDSRTVPVSIEGTAPVPFEWFLGDPSPVTVYQPYYETHKLLESRSTSVRLGGGLNGQRPQEPVATLSRVQFAGVNFYQVPGVFPSNAVRGSDSPLISGNIGLELLARFRLIIDYPHARLYAVPNIEAESAPFVKDRLGLYLSKQGVTFVVDFVSPGSPAQAAGFKVGERIAMINQKAGPAWTQAELTNLRFATKETAIVFTMESGSTRQVKAKDYF
ncbi:PDZ domain-containing protein [Dyella humi]|uniref:PDZ domain-containing protein n=1 Tax=Dyella humi TaxID=1770547 RepID=A0ABW8IF90_9GAMM